MENETKEYKRVVIKIGSSSLMHEETGSLNFAKLDHLVRVVCDLRNRGCMFGKFRGDCSWP